MSSQILFRRFEAADITAVKRLHEQALKAAGVFDVRYADDDLDSIEAEYLDKNGEFLVGTTDGQVVAMGAFRACSEPDTAELKRMRVRPEFQGRGIGSQLLELLEFKARDRGYTSMILDTVIDTAGQRLYERHDYQETRRDYSAGAKRVFYRKQL